MKLHVTLSDLMYATDSKSEFGDYGYFLDPVTGKTHLIWDREVDGADDPNLFKEMSRQLDDLIKLLDRSMTDPYQRARGFLARTCVDDRERRRLEKALRKAERKKDLSVFLGGPSALGLLNDQLAYWDACVKTPCASGAQRTTSS